MEGACRDEQDVIRAHHPITRIDRGAFDNWKNVALHAFPRNIGAVSAFASRDLVDFIQENDPGVLHAINRRTSDVIHIDQPLLFFLYEVLKSLIDLHLPLLSPLSENV